MRPRPSVSCSRQQGEPRIVDGSFRGRVSGNQIFNVVRRLANPDGSFRGVVVLVVSPQYLADFWKAIAAPGDTVSLVRSDGVVLPRYPEAPVGPDETPRRFDEPTMHRMRAEAAAAPCSAAFP